MEAHEPAIAEALRAPSPRPGFFDELLETLRAVWEVPVIAQAPQPAGHSPWAVAGSVAAATAAGAMGAGAAWYGLKRRHRRGGVA